MNKSDLIENLSSEAGLTIKKADRLVTLVFHEICEALAKGERVEIRGFGSFKTKRYGGYVGRNPKTSECWKSSQRICHFSSADWSSRDE